MSWKTFAPDRGDIVWLNFDPQAGTEQAGHRPALVLSPKNYNHPTGRAWVCPITSQKKGWRFEVDLPSDCGVSGVVLADQIKCVDWRSRKAKEETSVDEETVNAVVEKQLALLDPDHVFTVSGGDGE